MNIEQQFRLKKKRDGLQEEWNIQHKKVSQIRQALLIEARTTNKFQLEQQFKEENAKLTNLEAELDQVEAELKLGSPTQKLENKVQVSPLKPQPTNGEASPFITGAPITQPRYFFGREKELKRLFNLLKRHPLQNAAIIGKKRSGKTSLLHYLKNITTTPAEQLRPEQKSDWLTHPESYRWIFIDLQDARMQSREGLLKYILESLKMQVPTLCDLDYFMDVVSDNLHSPTVILLDEISVGLQRCPELDDCFWESLRSLATNHTGGNLAFVLATPESPIEMARNTGHSSPFFNIFGYIAYLGALTETEARELIASSPIPFTDEDVEWILTQSCCWPLLLQILCRERLFNLEEGENDDNWRDEGLRQMKPFADLLDS
ncbi:MULTISPECIES: ATP-binding protein [unclassified Nostoc]|uniref:ATP-binding protein n=1 Tax=unclassified Nostoc TaxID=2593658 RepID=UPI002624CD0C|nr:ATP-binding protein [Nostoc sp. S13]MDF5736932.1 ATP-binding protein [Nostoc sp. S13]